MYLKTLILLIFKVYNFLCTILSILAELGNESHNLAILQFCTLQSQYHIWSVSNFFLRSIFSILERLIMFFQLIYRRRKKIFRLR